MYYLLTTRISSGVGEGSYELGYSVIKSNQTIYVFPWFLQILVYIH